LISVRTVIEKLLTNYPFIMLSATMAIAIYGILAKTNVLKKVLSLTILNDCINTFYIMLGFRGVDKPAPPILLTEEPTLHELLTFKTTAVDPLPQCITLTAIVIGLSETAILLALAIQIYRHYGTLDTRKIKLPRG